MISSSRVSIKFRRSELRCTKKKIAGFSRNSVWNRSVKSREVGSAFCDCFFFFSKTCLSLLSVRWENPPSTGMVEIVRETAVGGRRMSRGPTSNKFIVTTLRDLAPTTAKTTDSADKSRSNARELLTRAVRGDEPSALKTTARGRPEAPIFFTAWASARAPRGRNLFTFRTRTRPGAAYPRGAFRAFNLPFPYWLF